MSVEATRVTAAIPVKDGAVLLARRPPGDRLTGFWELPGRKIEVGESPEAYLARELEEECGIAAQIGPLFAESIYPYAQPPLSSWPSGSIADQASWS
jgi:8-oxo-dGTP diphosphatase